MAQQFWEHGIVEILVWKIAVNVGVISWFVLCGSVVALFLINSDKQTFARRSLNRSLPGRFSHCAALLVFAVAEFVSAISGVAVARFLSPVVWLRSVGS